MKKGFFLLAALLCVTFLLIGCGGGPGGGNPGDNNDLNAQLNARSQAASSLQQVAKNAEQAGQGKMQAPSGSPGMSAAFRNILAAEGEEPEGEEPGGTHGPKWTGPDADGWYSITGYVNGQYENHVLKIKMKLPDDSTTMYKLEDITTTKDGKPLGDGSEETIGSEETTYTKGADGLVSGTSTYTRYYRFQDPMKSKPTDYVASATVSFQNFGADGTGHYKTTLKLVSTDYPDQGGTIPNEANLVEDFTITYNADKTKLQVTGTIDDGDPNSNDDYSTEWPLLPTQ